MLLLVVPDSPVLLSGSRTLGTTNLIRRRKYFPGCWKLSHSTAEISEYMFVGVTRMNKAMDTETGVRSR